MTCMYKYMLFAIVMLCTQMYVNLFSMHFYASLTVLVVANTGMLLTVCGISPTAAVMDQYQSSTNSKQILLIFTLKCVG